MAQVIEFKYHLRLDLESRAEEVAAHGTIEAFVTAQSGQFRWKTNQAGGGVTVNTVLLLPVADRSEVHAKCNAIEGNLDTLPRDGACVGDARMEMVQVGLPG
jgi:hypothetical protein